MSKLRRYKIENGIYFITSVTYNRSSILLENVEILWVAIGHVMKQINFELIGWVILPDHFHFLLNAKDNNPSGIMRLIKSKFSGLYRSKYSLTSGRVWQNRFWDHYIRDESDLKKHLDYIHFNPVKHGLVERPFDFEHSPIHDFF